MDKNLEFKLKTIKNKIDKLVKNYIKKNNPILLYEPAKYSLKSEGKRIRGLLCVLGYEAVRKGTFSNNIFYAASSLEILHLFTLIHDDIMDNADSRRGRETIHKKWDTNTAILTGDLLVGVAYNSLLKAKFKNLVYAINEFNDALITVCEGQGYDKLFETYENIKIKEYYLMIEKKTGKLIESSVIIGAILGEANKSQINSLSNYGKYIGRAFQIKDDLLDIIADEKKLGKSKYGDIKESKKTYFYAKALSCFNSKDLHTLKFIFQKKSKSNSDITKVVELFEKYNLIIIAENEINRLITLAKKSISNIDKSKRAPLELLADKLAVRTY